MPRWRPGRNLQNFKITLSNNEFSTEVSTHRYIKWFNSRNIIAKSLFSDIRTMKLDTLPLWRTTNMGIEMLVWKPNKIALHVVINPNSTINTANISAFIS